MTYLITSQDKETLDGYSNSYCYSDDDCSSSIDGDVKEGLFCSSCGNGYSAKDRGCSVLKQLCPTCHTEAANDLLAGIGDHELIKNKDDVVDETGKEESLLILDEYVNKTLESTAQVPHESNISVS